MYTTVLISIDKYYDTLILATDKNLIFIENGSNSWRNDAKSPFSDYKHAYIFLLFSFICINVVKPYLNTLAHWGSWTSLTFPDRMFMNAVRCTQWVILYMHASCIEFWELLGIILIVQIIYHRIDKSVPYTVCVSFIGKHQPYCHRNTNK